jgi:hypothetical protein
MAAGEIPKSDVNISKGAPAGAPINSESQFGDKADLCRDVCQSWEMFTYDYGFNSHGNILGAGVAWQR